MDYKNATANDGDCGFEMVTIPPDTRYELIFVTAQEGQFLETVTFDMTVHYFDGIPTNMNNKSCLLYTSPSPRDLSTSRMPSSA